MNTQPTVSRSQCRSLRNPTVFIQPTLSSTCFRLCAALLGSLAVKLDGRGNVAVDGNFRSSVPGIFAAGDMQRGQSLVVWAITGGRKTAHYVDKYLMGRFNLPL